MSSIKELSNLQGRRALVTGATGGLGIVIADTLAELGADLVLVDRPGSDFVSLSSRLIKNWGVGIETHYCDFEIEEQRVDLINCVIKNNQNLNILINNAAFVGLTDLKGWSVPFEDQSIDTWRRAIEVNLTAVFQLSQGLTPLLRLSQGSNIINIASIYGMFAPDWGLYEGTSMGNPAAYSASKGGLIQLTRWLATSTKPNIIRVNSISPGGIFRNQPQSFVAQYEARTPLGRMAIEDDLRGSIAYLATDLSKYVTGQNIVVDGGWGIW